MSSINFCTPVGFGDQPKSTSQSLLEFADDYFFFEGEKAVVKLDYIMQDGQGVELVYTGSTWACTALKIISYFTIILPALLFIAKCILRSIHSFYLIPPRPFASSEGLFFKQHKPFVIDLVLNAAATLNKDVCTIVADYVISEDCFGAEKWRRYFGVDVVDPEPAIDPNQFYRFWFGPDPIDPNKKFCETHFPPVLRPRFVTHIDTETSYYYNLITLGQLIQHPQEGYFSRYELDLHQFARTITGPSCWIVMRKDLLANGEYYSTQVNAIKHFNVKSKFGYEEETSAIDVSTALSAHYVATGEFHVTHLEDHPNHFMSLAQVKESDEYGYRFRVAGSSRCPWAEGMLSISSESLAPYSLIHESIGIAALRKFS